MTPPLEEYYLNKKEPAKSCLLALRSIILSQDPDISETQKYNMPCFCYRDKMFCYLWTNKKTGDPYILFVEGKHLNHPELETGDRSRMKILNINPAKNLPLRKINLILSSAINLYKRGIIKIP